MLYLHHSGTPNCKWCIYCSNTPYINIPSLYIYITHVYKISYVRFICVKSNGGQLFFLYLTKMWLLVTLKGYIHVPYIHIHHLNYKSYWKHVKQTCQGLSQWLVLVYNHANVRVCSKLGVTSPGLLCWPGISCVANPYSCWFNRKRFSEIHLAITSS